MGKQKLLGAIFSVRLFAPIFFESTLWAEKAVNFLNREGQKRGATHGPRQERFPLYATQWCQRCKNVTLCQRVTETPRYIPTVDFYFYICLYSTIATQNSDSELIIFSLLMVLYTGPRLSPLMGLYVDHLLDKSWAYICSITLSFYGLLCIP